MDVEALFAGEPYQQLVQAVRANDQHRAAQIVEEQIAGTEGADQAFWLLVRFAQRADLLHPEEAWRQLHEAVRVSGSHPYILSSVLTSMLHLAYATETSDRLVAFMGRYRHALRNTMRSPQNQLNLGVLHLARRRPRKARRCFSAALSAFRRLSPLQQEAFRGYVPMFHLWRSIARVASGWVDEAESDIQAALELYPSCNPRSIHFLVLAIARAEVSLAQGQLQEARTALQEGISKEGGNLYRRSGPFLQVLVQLLAARIARAEGNRPAFEHFCNRALTIIRGQDRPWTAARIRAVMSGAEW